MGVDLEFLSGPRVARNARISAALACVLVIATGAVVLQSQLRLARLAHAAIDEDAMRSRQADRAVVAALQCRRYEKDFFLNLNDPPTRTDYLRKWTASWEALRDGLDLLRTAGLPEETRKVDGYAAAARRYRRHFLEVVDAVQEGTITRPEAANRAITPFKDDVRAIIAEMAAFADAKGAQAVASGARLAESVVFNVLATCFLVVLPSGVIVAWTIWLTSQIIARNHKLAEAKRAAESADGAKSQFLANISHELRTPLHGILSYAKFGLEETATAERGELHEFFYSVDRCAENLLNLVNDLLDLSKLEAGRMRFEFQPADLGSLLEAVVDEFRSLCAERKIAICYEGPEEPAVARVDPGRIQQVIRNLLSNAAKFSPPAGTVRVRLRRAGEKFLLSVADEGPGVPADELEAVFDKFVQSSKTRSSKGGTGLGLAICREIVGGHNGRIWAENNAGAGCTFHCEIPAPPRQRSVAPRRVSSIGMPIRSGQVDWGESRRFQFLVRGPGMEEHGRVLIVDDNAMNVNVLRRILRKEYELDAVASGEDCLAKLAEFKPHLVLLDIMMPGMDGYETCRRIKSGPLGDSIQVMLVSGKGTAADRVQGYEAQADDYIVKPFDHAELLSKVRAHFRLRKLRAAPQQAEAQEAAARLCRLVGQMSSDIGEHTQLIEEIQRELGVAGSESPDALIRAMVRLADTNKATQRRLAAAERKLREEAREIASHASEARTDALTLLPNRRAFDEELARRLADADRRDGRLCAVMIDIDHFKQFNDQYGHPAGDEVLQATGRLLGRAVRQVDLAARYGGDEFAALVSASSAAEAAGTGQRIREVVEGSVVHFQERKLQITVSIGLAERMAGENGASLVKRADEALYASKKAGRNCIHWHDGTAPRPIANRPAPPLPALPPGAGTGPPVSTAQID